MTYMTVSERTAKNEVFVRHPSNVYEALKKYWGKRTEHFLVCTLNGAHKIISIRIVSMGLVNRSLVHPREVFYEAIKDMAAAIVVAHNHPSGEVEPSNDDRSVTKMLVEAGNLLGIKVLDHVIFSKKGYYSFLDNGEI